ncbi:MAG: methylated-DNA--[protein]-cysteine S-methyltransferase [Actinomycetota bacterium]
MNGATEPRGRDLRRLAAGADARSAELTDALADAADERGLVDVGIGWVDSPLGRLAVAVTRRGVLEIVFPDRDRDDWLSSLARDVSPRILESPIRAEPVRRQLDEYFAQRRTRFDLPVDRRLIRGFQAATLRALERVPYGSTSTYGDLARRAGSPKASRAIGSALGRNPIPIVIPCHRVVRTGGALGGYAGGLDRKRFLLELEGSLKS